MPLLLGKGLANSLEKVLFPLAGQRRGVRLVKTQGDDAVGCGGIGGQPSQQLRHTAQNSGADVGAGIVNEGENCRPVDELPQCDQLPYLIDKRKIQRNGAAQFLVDSEGGGCCRRRAMLVLPMLRMLPFCPYGKRRDQHDEAAEEELLQCQPYPPYGSVLHT
jgi:hypothetical protein